MTLFAPETLAGQPLDQVTLQVTHDTLYRYSQNVSLAHHLAHLEPCVDHAQSLASFELTVSPPSIAPANEPAWIRRVDAFGNVVHQFTLTQPHDTLHVRASSRVTLRPRFDAWQPHAGLTVREVADRLHFQAGRPQSLASEFAQPSPYVPLLADLKAWAAPVLRTDRPVAEAAIALMEQLHDEFSYRSLSTEIDTPLQQVFDQRQGVCQDFAHLMIGAFRSHGLAARYLSGYLLTHRLTPSTSPQDGAPHRDGAKQGERLMGADASHAWLQVWCPGQPGSDSETALAGEWLDLDPTNRLIPRLEHVRVAVGRDFADVTPLRGVIRGGGAHTLTVGVSTERVPEEA